MNWVTYVEGGRADHELRNQLLLRELPKIRNMARRKAMCDHDMRDELVHRCFVKMLELADLYDPENESRCSFWQYVHVHLHGVLTQYFKQLSRSRNATGVSEYSRQRVAVKLRATLGREVSNEELTRACKGRFKIHSKYGKSERALGRGEGAVTVDRLCDDQMDDMGDDLEMREYAKLMVEHLSIEDASLIWWWSVRGVNQEMLGAALGIGKSTVCSRIARASEKLRQSMAASKVLQGA